MKDVLLRSSKKIRMLGYVLDEKIERILKQVCQTYGMECHRLENADKIPRELNEHFYNFIFLEKSDFNLTQTVGQIRNIRGYETCPVYFLDQDKLMHELYPLLNEGVDAVFGKHFHAAQLEAQISHSLRHELQDRFAEQENSRKDLNLNKGEVVLCSKPGQIPEIPIKEIDAEVIQVFSEAELFQVLYSRNIWIVLIGVNAKWALPLVGKLKNDRSFNLQLILLRNSNVLDADVVEFFNQGGDDITSIRKPTFILTRQFNSRIEREFYYKEKYLNAIKTAAEKLPIRSEQNFFLHFDQWKIEAFHRPYSGTPGGDFYEVINPGDDSRLIILGDVMGKMWGAWFFSIAYLSYIRSTVRLMASRHLNDPAAILESLNDVIFRDFKLAEVFTTLSIVKIQRKHNQIQVASASGLPLLLIRKDGSLQSLKPQGTILGMNESSSFSNLQADFTEGDAFWLYTDGYLDQQNSVEVTGIVERFADSLQGKSAMHLESVDETLEDNMAQGFDDDRTLIRIRVDRSGNN